MHQNLVFNTAGGKSGKLCALVRTVAFYGFNQALGMSFFFNLTCNYKKLIANGIMFRL